MNRDEIERMPHRDPSLMSNEELLAALNSHDDLDAEIALRFHVIWSALDAALAREARLREALERCPPERPLDKHGDFANRVKTWWRLWARPALGGEGEG